MRIVEKTYFEQYQKEIGHQIPALLEAFDVSNSSVDVAYRMQASAVFSSNIEGNSVDLNSYMNSITAKENFKSGKEVQEIEDLVRAYQFCLAHPLNEKNFLKTHQIMGKSLLAKGKQGIYRNDRMGVFDSGGLVYLAIEPEKVADAMKEFFRDISTLLKADSTWEEDFYHAALIHLKLAHIHPFWDGNGRMARLLEKWFLSQKINGRAWAIQSEKFYKDHLSDYYKNINLGVNYYELDYTKCLAFLKMLPESLKI
ncbi:MAG: Fic family protein [Lewinellaceae bacterium]|nr:Fic family protein [Lewinellaceae bacterium]